MHGAVPYRLELEGISKRFPGVLANDNVALRVKPGEIHALLGENGAGKSTLVKMIYGIMQPDAGTIAWNGQPIQIHNPRAARKLGIGMVFQHFSLFEALTVLENIALGLDARLSPRELEARVRELSVAAFDTLDCEGLARVDFFVFPDGRVVLNEVETMPGFTSLSMFPRMWAASGVDYPTLVDRLVTLALGRDVGLR